MRLLILFVVLVFSSETYSQQKIFYINIQPTLKQGSIIFDLHADPKDSMFTITFGGFLKENEEVGFFLLCDRGYKKVMESSLNNGEILSPETTIDSLNKLGRSFFRKNKHSP